MTTFETIAEQVYRLLGVHTDESKLKRQEVIVACKQAASILARRRFSEYQATDVAEIAGGLIVTFKDIAVDYDEDREEFYASLPASITWFPYQQGISQVSPSKYPKTAYIPVVPGFNSLYEGLESANLQTRNGYYIENDKIYLVNTTYMNNPESLIIKIPLGYDGLEVDQPVNIPPDLQSEIINYVFAQYSPRRPEDNTNDKNEQI